MVTTNKYLDYHVVVNGSGSSLASVVVRGNNTNYYYEYKRGRPRLVFLLILSIISFFILWSSRPFADFPSSTFFLSSSELESDACGDKQVSSEEPAASKHPYVPSTCSSLSNGTICCDRSHIRTDVCYMRGDVRTSSASKSIFLFLKKNQDSKPKLPQVEKVKPYTRKWETSVMDSIDELTLIPTEKPKRSKSLLRCQVTHHVPAVFFSAGGYTGNVYHEFNDGLIPLYITSRQFHRKVVFVVLEYHNWWYTKYRDVLSSLSDHPIIDFRSDKRTHCFPEAIVGLRIHDELTVDPSLMPPDQNASIVDFRRLLDRAYRPRIQGLMIQEEEEEEQEQRYSNKPRLVLLSRTGSRSITNEDALVRLAHKVGFRVKVLRPVQSSELAKIYKTLNDSDVMVGVHGAAMTHLLFMRPGSVLIQINPIGTEWAAEKYYADPAIKLGLNYMKYSILPTESSLYHRYDKDDPVFTDPNSIGIKGWEFTKKIYLSDQTVQLNLHRFQKVLLDAHDYVISTRTREN